jgi:cytochrome b
MKKVFVYDSVLRLFHLLLAIGFVTAFSIGKFVDDESAVYPIHMMIGMTLSISVILRLIWGFVGTRYSRFSSFQLAPGDLMQYFKNLITSKTDLSPGHNPASSWAGIIMMICVMGLGFTGFQMVSGGNKEFFEEIHEIIAHLFALVVLGHVAGVVFHTIRHRDPIGLSMVTGSKNLQVEQEVEEVSSSRISALIFVFLVGSYALFLSKNYDPNTRQLHIFGQSLQLGELETENREKEQHYKNEVRHDEDSDSNRSDTH